MPCILYIANAVTSLQSSVSLGPQNSYLDYFFFPCGSFFFSDMYEFLYLITRAINRNSCHVPGSKALGQVTCTLLTDLSILSFSICAWCEALWMEQIEENSVCFFLGTYKCVKLIFVAVLTIGIWGVHGKFAGTFNMCLSRLLAYAQPYPPPPPFYLGGGREWIPVGYGFFGKGWRKPIQTNCPSCHGKYFILHWNRFSLIFATGLNSYLGFSLTQAPSINYFVIHSHFFH